MSIRSTAILLGALLTIGIAAPPFVGFARAEINGADADTLREAAGLLNRKHPEQALAKLAPLRVAHVGDVDFNVVYGLALLDSAKADDAVVAFRRVLTMQPDHFLARAHLGRALAALGELDDAKREIAIVSDRPDLPPETRAVLRSNLRKINQALEQRAQLVAQGQAGSGQSPSGGPRGSRGDADRIRTAAELIRVKQAPTAYMQLTPMAARLAGNPDFDYVYGVAALESGHPAEAATILRRALAARPDFHVARAHLGVALAAMGDATGAKRELEAVRNVADLPPVARDALGRTISEIDNAGTGKRINGYLESSLGYDTNVNAGPSNQTLLIPALAFLGPATLSPAAMPKSAGFYEIAGAVSAAQPADNGVTLFLNAAGNVHRLFSHDEFRSALAGAEAGIAKQIEGIGTVSVAGIGQAYLLGGSSFRDIVGASTQWRNRLPGDWDASLALSWLQLKYRTLLDQDTNRYTATGIIARRFESAWKPAFYVAGNVGREVAITTGSEFLTFTLLGVRVGGEVSPLPGLVLFAQASYESHSHNGDYPLFLVRRHDDLFEILGGMDIKVNDRLSVRPSVRYSRTDSNIPLFDQHRTIGQVAVRIPF